MIDSASVTGPVDNNTQTLCDIGLSLAEGLLVVVAQTHMLQQFHKVAAVHRYEEGCSLQAAFRQLCKTLMQQEAGQAAVNKAILAASSMVIKIILQVGLLPLQPLVLVSLLACCPSAKTFSAPLEMNFLASL